MRHYVYRLDDPITGEFYFGSRSCKCKIIDDEYMGSYYTWKPKDKSRLIKTILKSNFRKRETATKYEGIQIKENIDNALNRNYHIPNSGFHMIGRIVTQKTRDKISKSSTGVKETYDVKKRRSESGRKNSEVTRKKISEGNKGKVRSEETRRNISIAKTGIKRGPMCNETKLKIGKAQQGKVLTAEHKKNISIGGTGRYIGPMSDEHKKKLGDSQRGISQTKIKCPHCSKTGGISAMKRWHFDNCNNIKK